MKFYVTQKLGHFPVGQHSPFRCKYAAFFGLAGIQCGFLCA